MIPQGVCCGRTSYGGELKHVSIHGSRPSASLLQHAQQHSLRPPSSGEDVEMRALGATDRELAALMTKATAFAAGYWASLEERPSYPSISGETTAHLFNPP